MLTAFFFPSEWEKKVLQASDVIHWEGGSKEIMEELAYTGKQILWTNAMFGGMPSYQISMHFQGYHVDKVLKLLLLGLDGPVGPFFALMFTTYALLILMGVNPWLGAIGAFAFGLTTNNLVLFEAGHINKIKTLIYVPLITAGVILMLYKKRYFWGGALFALALSGNLGGNHIQMTYYFALALLILGVIWLVATFREKQWKPLSLVVVITVVGAALALGSVASSVWPTYEFSQETMRGKPILKPMGVAQKATSTGVKTSSSTDGLSWEYAMEWSNTGLDLLAGIVPGASGGSSGEKVKSGEAYKLLQANSPKNPDGSMRLPMYWGKLPFTSGPVYLGAIICFLFVLGLFLVQGPFKWWAGLAVLFTASLSLGSNFKPLQYFFFEFMPLYNKFRTPSSILTITAFFFPLLGILALAGVVQKKYSDADLKKGLLYAFGITGGITLFLALLGPLLFEFSSTRDATLDPKLLAALIIDRKTMLSSDAWRSFLLIAASAGLLFAYSRHWIKPFILIAGVGGLVVVDMWGIGRRYSAPQVYITQQQKAEKFKPRAADEYINGLEGKRGRYRVYDLSQQPFNSSVSSYYHNAVGGYSAAKLQRYQDLIDYHISKQNTEVLNMLNTKYIIQPDGSTELNPAACGSAWFVDSIRTVKTPNAEIEALYSFKAASEAIILDEEFDQYIGSFKPQKQGTIALTTYHPEHLVYTSTSNTEQLAVFSEIWYGPNKGWKAYIDSKEVPFVRANYALRALRIPAGKHQVEFRFKPQSVLLGQKISSYSSYMILLGFFGAAGLSLWQLVSKPLAPKNPSVPKDPNPGVLPDHVLADKTKKKQWKRK